MNSFNAMYGLDNYPELVAWVLPIALWSLVWKGLVLWVTARRGSTVWFVIFLILNTAGIGEIIYLLSTKGFSEIKSTKKSTPTG